MSAGPAWAAAQKVEAGLLGELRALKHAGFAGASARVRQMAHAAPDALTAEAVGASLSGDRALGGAPEYGGAPQYGAPPAPAAAAPAGNLVAGCSLTRGQTSRPGGNQGPTLTARLQQPGDDDRVTPTSPHAARPRWDTGTAGPQVNPANVLTAARAAALFASSLSACSRPADTEVAAAIRGALRAYGGTRGCAGEVAAAYGEHPETAAPRMRWALQVVQDAFPRCSDRRRKPPRPAAAGTTAPGASAPSSAGNRPRRPDSMPLEAPPPQGKISDRAAPGCDDNNEQSQCYRVDDRTRGAA